jgi:hypothetical protein
MATFTKKSFNSRVGTITTLWTSLLRTRHSQELPLASPVDFRLRAISLTSREHLWMRLNRRQWR